MAESREQLNKKLDRIAHELRNTRWPTELEDESREVYEKVRDLQEKVSDSPDESPSSTQQE